MINVPATLESRTSKDGNQYYCLVIKITDNVEKLVFLDKAETELIRLTYSSKVKLSSSSSQN